MRKLLHLLSNNTKDVLQLGITFPLRYVKELYADIYTLRVRGLGKIYLRRNSSDVAVVRQVLRDREYDFGAFPQATRINMRYKSILANGKTPLIIDAGANNGCSAVWFATQFPQAKIMAVEPDHQNASLCRRNTAKFQQITVAEAAIGCISGFVRLENPTNQPWAVRTTREGEKNGVPVITVNDILESSGPACALFILKIDIEGFESDLFGHNTEWLDQVTVVMIEPHDWMLPGQFTSLPFQRALTRHKFEILLKGDTLMYVSG